MALKPNVFLVNARAPAEDRFTAHWHYLLDACPDLAQAVVERICSRAGIAVPRFVEAQDHPPLTRSERPDFMLRCEGLDLVCEHKLEAKLGPRQLERYLEAITASSRGAKLILIANTLDHTVPDEVRTHPAYLYPSTRTNVPYFLWEDFHDLVKSVDERVASDFALYMQELGMNPRTFGVWGDPFSDVNARDHVRALLEVLAPYFNRRGTVFRRSPVSLGVEVRQPMDGVHLFYIVIDKMGGYHLTHPFEGRAVFLRVFGNRELGRPLSLRARSDGTTTVEQLPMSIKSVPEDQRAAKGNVLHREYACPLEAILGGEPEAAGLKLLTFVEWASEDVRRCVVATA